MSLLLGEFVGRDIECSYLPDRNSRTHYRLIDQCDPKLYQHLVERGWRRFGQTYFRPVCATCSECRSLRVDVDRFRPNRSMRRAVNKNSDLEITLQPVTATTEHLELYIAFHRDMAVRKSWPDPHTDLETYRGTFTGGDSGDDPFAFELLFRLDGQLVCVALVDILPTALSAVYCYYDPEHRSRSLGVFSILTQLNLAKERGFSFVYLGYQVDGNPSMRYKVRYGPHQILDGRPRLDQRPAWVADTT